jgi:uncharacterized protein (TIGR03067 family)
MTSTLLSCLLVLAVPAEPLNKEARKELKSLEGKWVVERLEANGEKHKPGADERMDLTIDGTKWSFHPNQEQGEVVALDPSCNPKVIDLKSVRAGRKPFVREGIYKRDGDTLIMVVYQGKDKKRPTSFDTPTEAGTVKWVLKRDKN